MNPYRLISILEHVDPSFRDLFYPGKYRCPLDDRIVLGIEQYWPAYFPTRTECRGKNWSLSILETEPLYKPNPKSRKKLADWKKSIAGTVAEIRAYQADHSWTRFLEICNGTPSLGPLLKDFKPLSEFLIHEESMSPKHGRFPVTQEKFIQDQMQALFASDSPYKYADPKRLKFVASHKPGFEKIRMIGLMRQLFDGPLMSLAILEFCASRSTHSQYWLPVQKHITAIIKAPSPLTFRTNWFEHVMQVSGATTKAGKSVPRKWARLLVGKDDLHAINVKAIEVHRWLHGEKLPSMENVRRGGRVLFKNRNPGGNQAESEKHLWLLSWMVTLWLEKHFTEISAEFEKDRSKIKSYYQRFFHYLKVYSQIQNEEGAGGRKARQPCD